MPARTPAEAVRALIEPLQRAISCVTPSVLIAGGHRPRAEPYAAVLSGGEPVRLRGPHRLSLLLALRYVIAPAPGSAWTAQTAAYEYVLLRSEGHELLAYHWHPTGRSPIVWPHVHLSAPVAPVDLTRAHLPTGPVALPAVLRCAVSDLGVRPLRRDWPAVLAAAERALAPAGE